MVPPAVVAAGGSGGVLPKAHRTDGTGADMQRETLLKDDVEAMFRQLRDDEKVGLLTGRDMWSAGGVSRLGLPPLVMSDGPHGARGCTLRGVDGAALAPCETALAATFNEALITEVGELLGKECVRRGAHMLLGPTVNIQRSPLFGRHFECFSEDPYLSARAAVAYVRGVQKHVAACAKHFAGNDQENFRHSLNTVVDERTLREIYLAPFEAAIKEADCEAVMCGYNRINGRFCTENHWLLSRVLREEWGFQGVAISDWFGNRATVASMEAGLNIEMPGIEPRYYGGHLLDAVRDGRVSRDLLDERARPVLALTLRRTTPPPPEATTPREYDACRGKLLRRAAAESMVLLKNEQSVLPLDPTSLRKIAVLGPNAMETVVQGGGSSRVRPRHCKNILAALQEALPAGTEIMHSAGCFRGERAPDAELEALKMMGSCNEAGQPSGMQIPARGADAALKVGAAISGAEWCRRRAMPVFRRLGWRHSDLATVTAQMQQGDHQVVAPEAEGWGGRPNSTTALVALALATVMVGGVAAGGAIASYASYSAAAIAGCFGLNLGYGALKRRKASTLLSTAERMASEADATLLVLGTHGFWESEGADQPHMGLPGRQDELVQRVVAAARGPVIAVLNAGSPKTLPWLDQVPAVLLAHFGGEEMAAAVVDTLLGASTPAGRLPYSWPRSADLSPALAAAPSATPARPGDVEYGEGMAVGYRGFPKEAYSLGGAVLFPFGHGLSYTSFSYGDLQARLIPGDGPKAEAQLQVRNAGARAGAEVVQLYAEVGASTPVLCGFARTAVLQPGEGEEVAFKLGPRQLGEAFDVAAGSWQAPAKGTTVRLHAGASLSDIRVAFTLVLE